MRTLQTLLILLIFGFYSCTNDLKNNLSSSQLADISLLISNQDWITSIKDTIEVDDYPVTNDMFEDKSSDNSLFKLKSGEIFSLDKVWFTNDTLAQTLVFELYTDYHRLYIYHLLNSDIPADLIRNMQLDISKSKFDNVFDTATFGQKQTYFNGFIKLANKINQHYFTSKKGFKLGDKKEKAVKAYGYPDKCISIDNIEKCEWKFEGDYVESEEIHPKAKTNGPLAKNSFGYCVTMYFRSDILIAMILSNDIP